jgi:hypothetical protein
VLLQLPKLLPVLLLLLKLLGVLLKAVPLPSLASVLLLLIVSSQPGGTASSTALLPFTPASLRTDAAAAA